MVLLVLGCGGGEDSASERVPQHEDIEPLAQTILFIIAPIDFQDEEFNTPYDLFMKSGFEVVVASTDTTPAKGRSGTAVKPDMTLEQVNADEFDGLVVVGGAGCVQLWDDEILHAIVRRFNAESKPIAASCLAPVVLARAEILKDRMVTAHSSVQDDIGKSCAGCTDADVEVSGNVITCSRPEAMSDFAEAMMGMFDQ
jgi:protease I